jgi:polygalacturonase
MDRQVIFEGETTFGYEEWEGLWSPYPEQTLPSTGVSDAYLNGDGSRWWDGEGSNGGKTKLKFFYAHEF